MEIFINDNKIDFQLENETHLKEVVDNLKKWAAPQGFIINEIKYDKYLYDESDEKCKNTLLSEISQIRASIKTQLDIHQENLQLLYQYVSLFLKALDTSGTHIIKELKKEARPICQLLSRFLSEDFNNSNTLSRQLFDNIEKFNLDGKDKSPALVSQLSALKNLLQERIIELSNPMGELEKTINKLSESERELSDISVLLQTGKDKEAWLSLTRFSELNQKTLRLYPLLKRNGIDLDSIVINELSFVDFYTELNDILTELVEAFTSNDSVLIGDIIEYEIVPRLSSLLGALEKIIKDKLS